MTNAATIDDMPPHTRRVLLRCLKLVRRDHPEWSREDLCRHLGMLRSDLPARLAQDAGFSTPGTLASAEARSVLRAIRRGETDPLRLAAVCGAPRSRVEPFLKAMGFGEAAWGVSPWPGPGQSTARKSEPRLVSSKGQISYRGRLYCLGAEHAGLVAWVKGEGDRLHVTVAKRLRTTLRKRT